MTANQGHGHSGRDSNSFDDLSVHILKVLSDFQIVVALVFWHKDAVLNKADAYLTVTMRGPRLSPTAVLCFM